MKFNLPRQIMSDEIAQIALREIKEQELIVKTMTKSQLKELNEIINEIKTYGFPKRFVIRKLAKELGHGVFLHPQSKPIERGEMISPYSGQVSICPQNRDDNTAYAFEPIGEMHLTKEEQKRIDPKMKFHPNRFYAIKLDAKKKGNFTRFINHSEKPNVIAHLMKVPKKNDFGFEFSPVEVVYFAKKRINPGEQLLVNYENEENSYWSSLNIKPFPMTPKTYQIKAS
ncbi:MAG: SET domain-containing protein [Simkaniaceae bacterium]|nr:SET domain-containing protein [Simkaniaceae bacterium]MCF7852667.1 SET domain-containing protein [Simkaniaceae bacterium]